MLVLVCAVRVRRWTQLLGVGRLGVGRLVAGRLVVLVRVRVVAGLVDGLGVGVVLGRFAVVVGDVGASVLGMGLRKSLFGMWFVFPSVLSSVRVLVCLTGFSVTVAYFLPSVNAIMLGNRVV